MLFRSDRKSTRLNSSHTLISYAVFCLKKKNSLHVHSRQQNGSLHYQRPCKAHHVHVHFFFFNDTATTEIYTLSLHDALPISPSAIDRVEGSGVATLMGTFANSARSEEHTSELQSHSHLVCRLLLEKKKQ